MNDSMVTVKLRCGDAVEEILMTRPPVHGKEINRQGKIWRVVGIAFLIAR